MPEKKIKSRKEWFVSDLTPPMQRRMCQLTERHHKSENELLKYAEGDAVYLTRQQLREAGLSFCDQNGKLVMVEKPNWASIPMAMMNIDCPDPSDPRHEPYERVIAFHTHPFGEPIPSHKDIMSLYKDPEEQISCIGAGDNRGKKVYCYEKPKDIKRFPRFDDLKFIDYINAKMEILRKRTYDIMQNDRFSLVFGGSDLVQSFYPFDVYDEEAGDYLNELTSRDVIDIYVKDDNNKHFETLPDELDHISEISKVHALEDEDIVNVHMFWCNKDNEWVPSHSFDPEDAVKSQRAENAIDQKII